MRKASSLIGMEVCSSQSMDWLKWKWQEIRCQGMKRHLIKMLVNEKVCIDIEKHEKHIYHHLSDCSVQGLEGNQLLLLSNVSISKECVWIVLWQRPALSFGSYRHHDSNWGQGRGRKGESGTKITDSDRIPSFVRVKSKLPSVYIHIVDVLFVSHSLVN